MALAIGGGSLIGKTTGFQTTSATKGGSGSVLGAINQIGAISSLLSGLISSETINKTIGQALKDGFDCWGSTWTPTRAETELPHWINLIHQEFTKALDVKRNDLETSVNGFFRTFWGRVRISSVQTQTLEGWLGWRYDSAKDCTLRGLIALEKGVDDYLNITLVNFLKEIQTQVNATITVQKKTITLRRREAGGKTVNVPYQKSVPQITVQLKADIVQDVKDLTDNKTLQVLGGVSLGLAALFALFMRSPDNKKKSKGKKLFR